MKRCYLFIVTCTVTEVISENRIIKGRRKNATVSQYYNAGI